jgi:hypothetical protein
MERDVRQSRTNSVWVLTRAAERELETSAQPHSPAAAVRVDEFDAGDVIVASSWAVIRRPAGCQRRHV